MRLFASVCVCVCEYVSVCVCSCVRVCVYEVEVTCSETEPFLPAPQTSQGFFKPNQSASLAEGKDWRDIVCKRCSEQVFEAATWIWFALRVPFEMLALGRCLEMVYRKVRFGNGLLHGAALQSARS